MKLEEVKNDVKLYGTPYFRIEYVKGSLKIFPHFPDKTPETIERRFKDARAIFLGLSEAKKEVEENSFEVLSRLAKQGLIKNIKDLKI